MTRGVAVLATALTLPSVAIAAEPELGVHLGRLWLLDSAEARFGGPVAALRYAQPIHGDFAAVGEISSDGEFAGANETCLGQVSGRVGGSISTALGLEWLSARAAAGLGVVWARLYAAPYFRTQGADSVELAWGDRFLPEAWGSVGLAAAVGEDVVLHAEAGLRMVPSARFRAAHVPEGTEAAHYPTFSREHALSTAGVSVGVAWRF